jgi:hypothetical protein
MAPVGSPVSEPTGGAPRDFSTGWAITGTTKRPFDHFVPAPALPGTGLVSAPLPMLGVDEETLTHVDGSALPRLPSRLITLAPGMTHARHAVSDFSPRLG